MRTNYFGVAIALVAQLALADETNSTCMSISDPTKRLECYDNANKKPEIPEGQLAAQQAVVKRLKDPDSARFGRFTQITKLACLGVNARNQMGGFTGEQQAILMNIAGSWLVIGFHNITHEQCVEIGIPAAQQHLSKLP